MVLKRGADDGSLRLGVCTVTVEFPNTTQLLHTVIRNKHSLDSALQNTELAYPTFSIESVPSANVMSKNPSACFAAQPRVNVSKDS